MKNIFRSPVFYMVMLAMLLFCFRMPVKAAEIPITFSSSTGAIQKTDFSSLTDYILATIDPDFKIEIYTYFDVPKFNIEYFRHDFPSSDPRTMYIKFKDSTVEETRDVPLTYPEKGPEPFGADQLPFLAVDKVSYEYINSDPKGGYGGKLILYVTGHLTLESPAASEATGTGSTPLTPEELYQIQLDKDFPAGNGYVGIGKDTCFVEAGKDGTSVNAWQAGSKIASFVVKDKDGAVVKAKVLGQKKIGDKYYISISAYSKAGGLNIAITDADREALKAKGISGILLDGKTALMEF